MLLSRPNFSLPTFASCLITTGYVALTLLGILLFSSIASAEYGYNFQEPVTETAREIYGLHMLIFWICVAIFVGVFSVMFYSIFKHRKSKNYEPSQFSHSTSVEVIWTIIPFVILVVMAVPATQVLIKMEDTTKSDLTIKITGYQWKWGYEYIDSDISFYATLSTPQQQIDQFDKENAQEQGENYLLETDNVLVVPSGRKVRALITANDVIHAWWVPAFGAKKDAIPGYINELWFNVDEGKEGFYRGQCAELCGKDHAFMPIVVQVVSGQEFDDWLAAGGSFESSGLAQASAATQEPVQEQLVSKVQKIEEEITEGEPQLQTSMLESEQISQPEQTEHLGAAETNSVIDALLPAANAQEPEWTKESLMAEGEKVAVTCNACHGQDGKGVGGIFPAIAGSAVANGDLDLHIDLVLNGKPGTAMAAFGQQLSDEQIAAVITYQRNSYGNDTGDVVLPADISAKRN